MSILTELSRLSTAKNNIAAQITAKGVIVPAGTKLDGFAALVAAIPVGGGELSFTTGSWPGTQSSANGTLGGTGDLRVIKFWLITSVEIFTQDNGATWKRLGDGTVVSFPLTVASAAAQGQYAYYATVYSIVGNTVSYRSYSYRSSNGTYQDRDLSYAVLRQ